MKVILSGGGTAGHINPALSIADTIAQKEKGSKILFVGTRKGLESTLVPNKNYDIKYIDVSGIKSKLTVENAVSVFKYLKAVSKCKKILKDFCPDVVIGTGGYVCAPVVAAANSLNIPTVIHEQNVFPGNAVKMLSKKSTVTAISFSESEKYLKGAKQILYSGNPLRTEILNASREDARKELNLGEEKFLVIFGGSLGAKTINDVACEYIKKYADEKDTRILLATGKFSYDRVKKEICKKYSNVEVKQYIHNMSTVMAAADLIVCRSGAITVSEISALGVPSILVPSPNVTRNHQEYNARALSDDGGAVTILEKDFNVDSLKQTIDMIFNDSEKSNKMRIAALSKGKLNASELIYEKILEITKK